MRAWSPARPALLLALPACRPAPGAAGRTGSHADQAQSMAYPAAEACGSDRFMTWLAGTSVSERHGWFRPLVTGILR